MKGYSQRSYANVKIQMKKFKIVKKPASASASETEVKTIKTVLFLQQCTSRDLTLLLSCAAWWGSGPILATLRGGEWAHIGHTGVCVSALHVRQQKQYFKEHIGNTVFRKGKRHLG